MHAALAADPYFDYDAMWDAYELLVAHADGFPLQMGFEVNYRKLMELGMQWAEYLHFDGSNEFLLELSSHCIARDFEEYERTIYELQGKGYDVIIAHPERYKAIQKDVSIAERLVRMGCKLQASADFVAGGRFGKEKKPAKKLFDATLYRYIASDAHRVEHYQYLAEGESCVSLSRCPREVDGISSPLGLLWLVCSVPFVRYSAKSTLSTSGFWRVRGDCSTRVRCPRQKLRNIQNKSHVVQQTNA